MTDKNTATRIPHTQPRTLLVIALQTAMCGLPFVTVAQTADPTPTAESPRPAESTLPLVKVTAEDETATGPVGGYVAKRSATATKTDTLLTETPRSISVITREQIEAQNASSMQEALGYTPGLFAPPLATSSSDSTASLAIRGFSANDGEIFYQDGTRVKFPGWYSYSGYEPYAFERIEVLRGPASILYGQGQPNGTVNLVTKRPTTAPVREIGAEFGSFNQKELSTDLGGALDSDGEWSYRVTALARDGDTQIDDAQDGRRYFSGALAWRPSDKTELILRASFQRNEGERNNNLPAEGTLLSNPNGVIPRERAINANNDANYDSKNISWLFEHEANETWTIRSAMRLNQTTGRREAATFLSLDEDMRTAQRRVTNYWSMGGNFNVTLDNNAQAKFATGNAEHTVLVGVDYARQRDGWREGDGTVTPLDLFDPTYTPVVYDSTAVFERTANDQQVGLYVQDQVKINQRWILLAGGRQDWARSSAESGDPGATVPEGPKQKDEAFTFQVASAYLIDGGLTPYFSYAESYVPTLGMNRSGDTFKPETGRQYEAGVKFQPTGSESLVTAAVFDIRRQNVLGPDPANEANRLQRGEITSRGVELEARSALPAGRNLIATYAYTKTEVTKSDSADLGKELQQSPRNTASLWLDRALGNNFLPELNVGGGLRYVGSTFADETNTLRVPDYVLVDLSVRYDLSQVSPSLKSAEAYLNVKNLADKTYLTCSFGVCLYGIERSVAAGVRYAW